MVQALFASGSLGELRKEHEAKLGKTAEPITAFQTRYEEELGKLQERGRSSGDLDLLLALEKEIEGFREGDTPEATQESLRKLQKIYAEQMARLTKERAAAIGKLNSEYQVSLKKLETGLTQAGDIDAALDVRREHERIELLSAQGVSVAAEDGDGSPTASHAGMEEKADRKSDEALAEWLAGTVWKRGTGDLLRFEKDGGLSHYRSDTDIATGTYTVDEEEGHVHIVWSEGGANNLELASDQIRLNDRLRSNTWVRIDQHLKAVEALAKRGIPESERQLESRLKGTVWSRNHGNAAPFLYEFEGKGKVFLSIWGGDWRNPQPYVITGPRQLTIEGRFEMEFSEDFSTWRSADGNMTGLLIRMD
ncbi:MAG: hypothetical protein WD342_01355 [Verrucomicrobiales bacterium]